MATTLDMLIEIAQLKKALGLTEPRAFTSPKGSSSTVEGTKGRCVVCDQEFEAEDTIRRCAKTTAITDKKGNTTYHVTGYRVCFKCCPSVPDWMLERYNQNHADWQERWKQGLDPKPSSRSVFELDLTEKTEDEEQLELRILRLEHKLGFK